MGWVTEIRYWKSSMTHVSLCCKEAATSGTLPRRQFWRSGAPSQSLLRGRRLVSVRHVLTPSVRKTASLAFLLGSWMSDQELLPNLFRRILESYTRLGYSSSFRTPTIILRAVHATHIRAAASYLVERGQLHPAQNPVCLPLYGCSAPDTNMGSDWMSSPHCVG